MSTTRNLTTDTLGALVSALRSHDRPTPQVRGGQPWPHGRCGPLPPLAGADFDLRCHATA